MRVAVGAETDRVGGVDEGGNQGDQGGAGGSVDWGLGENGGLAVCGVKGQVWKRLKTNERERERERNSESEVYFRMMKILLLLLYYQFLPNRPLDEALHCEVEYLCTSFFPPTLNCLSPLFPLLVVARLASESRKSSFILHQAS